MVEDHRAQVLQAGFTEDAFEEICCIAEQFDKLRLFNRMQDEPKISDRELADFFETKFLKAVHGAQAREHGASEERSLVCLRSILEAVTQTQNEIFASISD